VVRPRKGEPPEEAFRNAHLSRLLAACVNDPEFKFRWNEPLQVIARRFKLRSPEGWARYVAKYEWTKEVQRDVYGIRD